MKIHSKELAYWIGLVQADGSLKRYKVKRNGRIEERIQLDLNAKANILLKKFQEVNQTIFQRSSKIWKIKKSGIWTSHIGVKRLLLLFDRLDIRFSDPPTPPSWVLKNHSFFGAYLAGVIDGDGDIRIKRPKYPQCVIRITSGASQNELKEAIKRILKCSVSITENQREVYYVKEKRIIKGKSFRLEFLVSKKNINFIIKYVLPFLSLSYKREKILNFFKMRSAPTGI